VAMAAAVGEAENSGGGGGGSYVNLDATDVTRFAGVHSGNGEVSITPVTSVPVCYCRGTRIQTARGEVAVEHLAIGDLVITQRGEARPIVWIGTGRALATRGRRNAATPVIVRKGALADNVPHRDLRVTKGHSLYLDGVLIPVEFLVNHRSILWDDRAQEVQIYHIELETHDVLIADGAPAESYRDDGNRWLFRSANSGWTDGNAELRAALFAGFDGPMELVLHVGGTTRYPMFAEVVGRAAA